MKPWFLFTPLSAGPHAQEWIAESGEQWQDVVAEAKAEHERRDQEAETAAESAATAAPTAAAKGKPAALVGKHARDWV